MDVSSRTSIGGETRTAAVIGRPVRHSLSPRIHNAAFAATHLDWVYLALDVAPGNGAAAVGAKRHLGIDGMSVTMPHKDAVALAADVQTAAAERLGASNCLYWRGDQIVADSTDGDGFVAAYCQRFDETLEGRSVAVFGAGAAARSIIEALGRNSVEAILVFNRSADRLSAAVAMADQAQRGSISDLADIDVIVNASSVGMHGGPTAGSTPFDVRMLGPEQTVVDIVYNPTETPLLSAASANGSRTQGGVAMLVHQAALAFESWTNRAAPIEAMMAAVADRLG